MPKISSENEEYNKGALQQLHEEKYKCHELFHVVGQV